MENNVLSFIDNNDFKSHLNWLKSSKRKDLYYDKKTNAINEAKSYLSKNGRTLVAMSLYGSQNYNLDIEDKSDFDFYAVVLPHFHDLVFHEDISDKLILKDGGHLYVKDLSSFFKELKKCSFNSLEILSHIKLILQNNDIDFYIYDVLKDIEDFCFINPETSKIIGFAALQSLYGMLGQRYKVAILKQENLGKDLSKILFIKYFSTQIIEEKFNEDSFKLNGEILKEAYEAKRIGKNMSLEEFTRKFSKQNFDDYSLYLQENILKKEKETSEVKKEFSDLLDRLLYNAYSKIFEK